METLWGLDLHDPSLARASKFLDVQRFKYETEPLQKSGGKNPDIFVSQPAPMWIEVKTLERQAEALVLDKWWGEFRKRAQVIPGAGRARVWVDDVASHGEIKRAFNLVRQNLSLVRSDRRLLVVVPSDTVGSGEMRFSFQDGYGEVQAIYALSATKSYSAPFIFDHVDHFQLVEVVNSDGVASRPKYYELVNSLDNIAVAILVDSDDPPFRIASLSRAQGAYESQTKKRIRKAVREAYSQLRAGANHQPAPCLVFVYNDDLGAQPDQVVSAAYGDLAASFPKDVQGAVEFFYGRNGVFRPDRNRLISGIVYFCDKHAAVLVHNYWANHTIPNDNFRIRQYRLFEDGQIMPVGSLD